MKPPKAPWSPGWAAFRAALRLHGGQDWGFDEGFKHGVLVYCRPFLVSPPPRIVQFGPIPALGQTGPIPALGQTGGVMPNPFGGPADLPTGYFDRDMWAAIAWCQADDTTVVGTYGELRSDEFWHKRAERRALSAPNGADTEEPAPELE